MMTHRQLSQKIKRAEANKDRTISRKLKFERNATAKIARQSKKACEQHVVAKGAALRTRSYKSEEYLAAKKVQETTEDNIADLKRKKAECLKECSVVVADWIKKDKQLKKERSFCFGLGMVLMIFCSILFPG